jgi:exopolyphosphatase/guanosine-5'-triphosphate,3'-diphosphate pyrophosphatase
MERTLSVLRRYGETMEEVDRRAAMATSATRDASNREVFLGRAEEALGVRPRLITGVEEARYAFAGATGRWDGPRPWVVSDIGGGSTEFVTDEDAISIDIGSVRLTERWFDRRPVGPGQLGAARGEVAGLFQDVILDPVGSLLGVAGTWTEMGGLVGGLERDVDLATVTLVEVSELVPFLAGLSVDETAHLPTLNPKRAGTILGGVVVAEGVMKTLGADTATQSIADTLDGLARELLAVT